MEGVLAVVTCFAADFAPRGWAYCNGQVLSIAQNQALFSLLGTTYGGNGVTTFALPDMRGRTAISAGQGGSLPTYTLGQPAGTETASLTIANLPPHNHNGNIQLQLKCDPNTGSESAPDGFYPAGATNLYSNTPTAGKNMLPPHYVETIGIAGSGQPFEILPPYLVVNYIICLQGIFPSRN